jgi:hypothetical protein
MFLKAAVQIADMRDGFPDNLAVKPQLQPQHAVRARMLGPHVDDHLVAKRLYFNEFAFKLWRCHNESDKNSK